MRSVADSRCGVSQVFKLSERQGSIFSRVLGTVVLVKRYGELWVERGEAVRNGATGVLGKNEANTTSATHGEPLDQRLRKMGGTHALLDDRNIVRHAPKLDDLMLQVSDGKCRARIAVTRLSDRTRIKKIAPGKFDAQRCKRFVGARTNLKDLELRILIGKAALVMRVPEKSHCRGGVQKAVKGLRGSEDVLVFVLKRSVNEHDAIRRKRSRRQGR